MKGWTQAVVIKGNKIGRTLGFPTLNLNVGCKKLDIKEGIYACLVKTEDEIKKGVLFFGPRLILGETKNVLEIFLLDFHADMYGKSVNFMPVKFLRRPENFSSFDELKKQIRKDCEKTEEIVKID